MANLKVRSRSKRWRVFLTIFLGVVGSCLILAFARFSWCVYMRSCLCTIFTGDDPQIPAYFTGTWKEWRRDGSVKGQVEVVKGVRHGRYVSWYIEGPKATEKFYKNGKLHGPFTVWWHDGRKILESFYENGAEHGKVTTWARSGNGDLISVTWKCRGYRVLTLAGPGADIPRNFTGVWKIYREDGRVSEEMEVSNGIRHGRFVTWHEEGPKASEGYFNHGKPHGKLRLWYEDGLRRNQTSYKEGLEHGKSTNWDWHGNLLSVTWHYRGRLVSKEEFEKLTTSEEGGEN